MIKNLVVLNLLYSMASLVGRLQILQYNTLIVFGQAEK